MQLILTEAKFKYYRILRGASGLPEKQTWTVESTKPKRLLPVKCFQITAMGSNIDENFNSRRLLCRLICNVDNNEVKIEVNNEPI